jgi:tripartite-type tricarboxylate transporter receptor subunit TctC
VVFEALSINPRYILEKEIIPIIGIATDSNILVVNPNLQIKKVSELVTYSKNNPGKINFASGGVGSSGHLAGELFKLQTGIDMVHIAYKGAGPAIQDVISGTVTMMFSAAPVALPLIKSGKLIPLAVTSESRSTRTPEIPSLSEFGYQFNVRGYHGLAAPVGTPASLINQINSDVKKVLEMDEVKDKIAGLGSEILSGTSNQFSKLILDESQKWRRVIKDANIQKE